MKKCSGMGFWSAGFLAVFAVSGFAWAGGRLTPSEEKRVLIAVESECADTWCEGDYELRFESFRCELERRVCRLDFRAGRASQDGGRVRWTIKTFCILHGIGGIPDLLEGSNRQEHLKDSAYDQINHCMDYRLGS